MLAWIAIQSAAAAAAAAAHLSHHYYEGLLHARIVTFHDRGLPRR